MTTRNRTRTVLTLLAVAMTIHVIPVSAKEIPAQLPDPDGKAPDTRKPVKVYILAGQSNMLEMGNVTGGSSRHSTFFTSADGDVSGVEVSVYPGGYSPAVNYDELTAKATQTVRYGGTKPDPFPTAAGAGTHVVRGLIEVKTSGVYTFSPGYRDSKHNVMELDGREVYRKEPGREAVQSPSKMTGGKRYPFKVTFMTKAANGLFWLRRMDIPGTLESVVKNDKKFQHLIDNKGIWTTRNDVYYYEARIHFKGGPLTVGRGIGPELQFGHIMGYYHDEQVLVIKTAMGNRALAWDFRPPSSGKLPDIPENLKKWEGREYRLMVEGVRKTLKNIATILPNYKGQGYEIAGFAWFQGHKDGGKQEWTDEYESNLVNLINDVRAEFKAPKLPVVVATVGFGGREMKGRYLEILKAQMAVSGEKGKYPDFAGNVLTVDTRDFWRSVEKSPSRQGHHYNRNAETYMLVGDALGRGMVKLMAKPTRKNVKLPGLVINFQKRCVDLEGSICLDRGLLELIACTKGSKEHESIVAIKARPMHVHAALLLLGANPGNPAMWKPIDEKGSRWIDIPPKGDPVDVYLAFKNREGKMVEHPISDFVARSGKRPWKRHGDGQEIEFPHTFLFAGSLLRSNGPGPRTYLSDLSGNVISIATFGDELLCLPGIHGQQDGSLMWQVDPAELPKVGSKVTLRLRPKRKPAPKAGKADQPRSVHSPTTRPSLKR